MKKILLTSVLIIAVAAIFATSPLASSRSQINAGFGFSGWGVPVYQGPEDASGLYKQALDAAYSEADALPDEFELLSFEPELEALMFFYVNNMRKN